MSSTDKNISLSRIGKQPVVIPDGVKAIVDEQNIRVEGKLGKLEMKYADFVSVEHKEKEIIVHPLSNQKKHRSLHGTYRVLIANMVEGVSKGFEKKLELVGVGYRAAVSGQVIEMSIGYSHNIAFQLPDDVKATAESTKGKAPIITLTSIDKQLIGMVAAKIRSLRKPEPYKGKGIKYVGEQLIRKAGKSAKA